MKIVHSLAELPSLSTQTSIAIGLFDGLHKGHQAVIRQAVKVAKEKGYVSTVFTFQLTGKNPLANKNGAQRINTTRLFYHRLEELGVEMVVSLPFSQVREMSPEEFVTQLLCRRLNTAYISSGADFRFGKNAEGTWLDLQRYGEKCGMKAQAVPLLYHGSEVISSTGIRRHIQRGEIPAANDLLGHRYAIDFEVVGGEKKGRSTFDMPTINQPYPPGFVLPKFGVYATLTRVDGRWYTSVTNVGVKPSVGTFDALAETHIHDYKGQLYGRHILVEFLQFLRHEVKFDDLEQLREQMIFDSEEAGTIGHLYL